MAVGFFVFLSVIEDITNVTGSIELFLAVASGKEVLFVSVVIVSLSKIVDDVTGNIALLVLFLTIGSDDKGGIPVWLFLISAVVEYVVGVAVSYDTVLVASPIPVLTGTKDTFISFLISSLFEVDWDEMAVNVAFITSVIKVLDLTGSVEDLFKSVISAWEVVIVFVLPFEINVAGNVFGATVVFVSLWSGVTVSKAAVFSFLNSSVIENVSGFVAIVSFFTVATSKLIVLISFFDVGEITNCCATVKVSWVKVATCFAVKLVLFGILFLSDVLSNKAWTIVVKIVSKSLFNDCEFRNGSYTISNFIFIWSYWWC